MPSTAKSKLPADKKSHELLADIFAAAPMIRDLARQEHYDACTKRRPGSYYDPQEQFTSAMVDFAENLVTLSDTFYRTLRANGIEVKQS